MLTFIRGGTTVVTCQAMAKLKDVMASLAYFSTPFTIEELVATDRLSYEAVEKCRNRSQSFTGVLRPVQNTY